MKTAPLLLVACLLVPETAFADLLPPDACDSAGASCNTAGPDHDKPGVCTQTTCSYDRRTPQGIRVTESPCTLCKVKPASDSSSSASSSSTASSSSSGSSGSRGSGGPETAPPSDVPPKGGCASCTTGGDDPADVQLGVGTGCLFVAVAVALGTRRKPR